VKRKIKNKKPKSRVLGYSLVILAAIILVAGGVYFFSDFFRTYSFEDAVKEIQKIDENHNVSFSDYEKGLEYIYSHPPKYPLNAGQIEPIVRGYAKIRGNEAVNLFVDFRKNLLEADKYYKLSQKTYKADPHTYGLRCSYLPYIQESAKNQNLSAQKLNASVTSLSLLKEKYPDNFEMLNISDSWIKLYSAIQEDFKAEISYKAGMFDSFCSNNTSNSTRKITRAANSTQNISANITVSSNRTTS